MVIVNVSYVVDPEDESLFDDFDSDGSVFYFGAKTLRGRGMIDEQHHTLDSNCVTKVTRK